MNEAYRLPSDHEWSCAVGIGGREDPGQTPEQKQRKIVDIYPWGQTMPPPSNAGNYAGEEARGSSSHTGFIPGRRDPWVNTAPVGSFAPNALGLYDLAGNVWEWCAEKFSTDAQSERILRGGAWSSSADSSFLLSSERMRWPPGKGFRGMGFRVVLAASAP